MCSRKSILISSWSSTIARSAKSTVPVFSDVSILFRKFMSLRAVSSFSEFCRNTFSSFIVYFRGDCFEMMGVYTKSIFTKMVKLKTFWDFSIFHFITKSMCSDLFFVSDREFSISFCRTAKPVPTLFSLVDLYPKSFFQAFHVKYINTMQQGCKR